MKALILTGGRGTRISEETGAIPKPLVEIGGRPILWHIMKIIAQGGVNDFVICAGYKQQLIKQYFVDYVTSYSDIKIDFSHNLVELLNTPTEQWTVTVVDTGENANTGERVRKALPHVGDEFILAYGDTVADVDIGKLIDFHRASNKEITVTAMLDVDQSGRIELNEHLEVERFEEKPVYQHSYINRGFFVVDSTCLSSFSWPYNSSWEKDVLPRLVDERRVSAYVHKGFVQSMDTLKEKNLLNDLWAAGAPWKVW